jgi:Mlc titration factor MtfA (ptsG expression regulator)
VGFLRSRHRLPALAPDHLALLTRRWFPWWRALDHDERDLLLEYTGHLVHSVRWEAARGFRITDDVRVAVAAHASLLVLGLDDGLANYADISSVIVHATTIVRTGQHHLGDGLYSDDADPLIGEAIHRGPVVLAWDAVADQALWPQRGENVVLHEFAHRLDMLDGITDGTPPLADDAAMQRWVAVCTASLARLRAHLEPSCIRAYAQTNPAEFFAVVTEVFFTRPQALLDEDPDLYGVLRDYYRLDPVNR